ncbi:MAG: BlaR1 family beta-lactam sensor/signal transducer [Defluviitaleaceae bacterium]|nr:BlaR1 family beta-lactam sensor/signal transducer [Defluviitaleaceae bacterium]
MSSFTFHFMAATFVSSIGMVLVLIVKSCLKKHLSAGGQYNLGFLYFALLAIPLIPRGFFSLFNSGSRVIRNAGNVPATSSPSSAELVAAYSNGWLQDFALAADSSAPGYIPLIAGGLWISGVIFSAGLALLCNRKLRLISESVKPIKDDELLSLFFRCKEETGVKRDVLTGTSVIVNTPMTMGFFKPVIILPATKMKPSDARYAILHELAHCKKRDIQVNGIMCLFQILFWFNPLVHIAFKRMRLDRELACDAFVLEMLPKEQRTDYGRALLNFVSKFSRSPALLFITRMGGSKPQIVSRVKHIASYVKETSLLRAKSICIFVLMGILVMCKIPVVSAFANTGDDIFIFRAENVTYSDLSDFFDGLEGSFVLYDLNEGAYTIHNRGMSVTRVSPNSTYKIFSALIAMETGILDSDNTGREWDGTLHPFESWNQNHNLASAMQSSVNWYFQDFDRQTGIEQLYSYLAQLSYGNRNLSGGVTDFWAESSLRISPVEQVRILRDLHQGNTIFEARHTDAIKDALQLAERDGVMLAGKTGTGIITGAVNGWFIGFVEADSNTFFFATYVQGDSDAGGSAASLITLDILEYKGIF